MGEGSERGKVKIGTYRLPGISAKLEAIKIKYSFFAKCITINCSNIEMNYIVIKNYLNLTLILPSVEGVEIFSSPLYILLILGPIATA